MLSLRISVLLVFGFLSSTGIYGQNQSLSSLTPQVYLESIANLTASDSIPFATLRKALKITHLDDLIAGECNYTIFAPSEVAFANLSSEKRNKLFSEDNVKRLNYILSSHIIPEKLTASKILAALCKGGGRAVFTTLQGNKLIATMSGLDILITDNIGNTTKITHADVNQDNTVIHEIDSLLVSSRL